MSSPDLVVQDDAADSDGPERRASVRYSSDVKSLCQRSAAQTSDFWLLAKVRDVSKTGVSLLLNCSFKPGAVLDIEPIKSGTPLNRILQAKVVRIREEGKGSWVVGCRFSTELTAEELQALS